MLHTLRKECSALLCEGIQGAFWISFLHLWILFYLVYLLYIARIDDKDPGYEHDLWMKRTKPTEDEQELRADRCYYKTMDKLRDNPEQSGMYCTIVPTFNAWLIFHTYST